MLGLFLPQLPNTAKNVPHQAQQVDTTSQGLTKRETEPGERNVE